MRCGISNVFLLGASLLLAACTKTSPIPAEAQSLDVASINRWHCGQQTISTDFSDERLKLTIGEKVYWLEAAISASGAKYQSGDDEQTILWFKGPEASLTLQGRDYPLCLPRHGISEPWRASGNEPFWTVVLDENRLALHRLGHESVENLPYQRQADGLISADSKHEAIGLRVRDAVCADTMSDMVYPQQIEAEFAGERLTGCGGEPARLLQGVEWIVDDVDGRGIIDNSRVTLNFETDGRINGSAGCNRFMGNYQFTGESLTLGPMGATKMACAPALMKQEAEVLRNLDALRSFTFDESGALVLRGGAGSLRARAESW